jgi:MtrB/PioB family decaheme-associated outer membrane protein
VERDYSDVEESTEHSGTARLNWRPRNDFDAALRLGASSREASEYQAVQPDQNPLLRKYNIADRDRDTAGIVLSYAPTDQLNIGFSADMSDDDYTDSSVGLTEGESVTYNLDVGYRPTENLQFTAFYTYDQIQSQQIGDTGSMLYRVDFDDQVDTLGLSADMTDLWKDWDLGLRYTYSKGTGDIEHSGAPYPTLENAMHRVELSGATDLNRSARLKLAVIYESLDAEDWAVDGFSATPTDRLVTLGNESEDYDVVAFLVALQYRF